MMGGVFLCTNFHGVFVFTVTACYDKYMEATHVTTDGNAALCSGLEFDATHLEFLVTNANCRECCEKAFDTINFH